MSNSDTSPRTAPIRVTTLEEIGREGMSLPDQMRRIAAEANAAGDVAESWIIRGDKLQELYGSDACDPMPDSENGHVVTFLGLPYTVGPTRHGLGAELVCRKAV